MRCYNNMYMGPSAKKDRYHILKALRNKSIYLGLYIITTPTSDDTVLEIMTSSEFINKYYDKAIVIGIADGKTEAKELVRDIINDMYHKTGVFDIYAFCNLDRI